MPEFHGTPTWSPNTDVHEGPDEIIVKMELAGVPADRIHLSVENKVLVVEGAREETPVTGGDYRYRQMEIEYGPFRRVLDLPYAVDSSRAQARLSDGILVIRLPRARQSSGQRIRVKMEAGS